MMDGDGSGTLKVNVLSHFMESEYVSAVGNINWSLRLAFSRKLFEMIIEGAFVMRSGCMCI